MRCALGSNTRCAMPTDALIALRFAPPFRCERGKRQFTAATSTIKRIRSHRSRLIIVHAGRFKSAACIFFQLRVLTRFSLPGSTLTALPNFPYPQWPTSKCRKGVIENAHPACTNMEKTFSFCVGNYILFYDFPERIQR